MGDLSEIGAVFSRPPPRKSTHAHIGLDTDTKKVTKVLKLYAQKEFPQKDGCVVGGISKGLLAKYPDYTN